MRHLSFHHEIEKLKERFMQLGSLVEDRVHKACMIIDHHDPALTGDVIGSDWEIDEMEVEVEEECLKILALHQPVARDLRFLVAVIKINSELERIADIAVNVAKRVQTINKNSGLEFSIDYTPMTAVIRKMFTMSLDSLVLEDAGLARRIFLLDEQVDRFRDQVYRGVIGELDRQPGHAACLVNLYLLSRHLERMGDRCTNIAEEVIYLVEGEIVRGENG